MVIIAIVFICVAVLAVCSFSIIYFYIRHVYFIFIYVFLSISAALEAQPPQPPVSQKVDSSFIPSVSSDQIENAALIPSYPKTSLSPPDLNVVRPSPYSGKSETAIVIDRETMLKSYLKKPISNPNPKIPTISDNAVVSPNPITITNSARDPNRNTIVEFTDPTTRTDGPDLTTSTITDSIDANYPTDENPNPNPSPSPDAITISLRTDQPQADGDYMAHKPWMKASKKPLSNNAVELVVGNFDGDNDNNGDAMYVGRKYKSISRWSVSSDVAQVVARKKIVVS